MTRSRLPLALVCALLSACSSKDPPPLLGTLEWDRIAIQAEAAEPIASMSTLRLGGASEPLARKTDSRMWTRGKRAPAALRRGTMVRHGSSSAESNSTLPGPSGIRSSAGSGAPRETAAARANVT